MVLMEKTILSSEILENFIYIKNGCLGTSVDVSLFLIDLCECSDRLFFWVVVVVYHVTIVAMDMGC